MASEASASTAWRASERPCACARRPGRLVDAAISAIVMHPIARRQEGEGGEHGDDDDQDPGERRGVAHAEIGEGLLVEIERVEERRVDRTARAAADDEGGREGLEGVDR